MNSSSPYSSISQTQQSSQFINPALLTPFQTPSSQGMASLEMNPMSMMKPLHPIDSSQGYATPTGSMQRTPSGQGVHMNPISGAMSGNVPHAMNVSGGLDMASLSNGPLPIGSRASLQGIGLSSPLPNLLPPGSNNLPPSSPHGGAPSTSSMGSVAPLTQGQGLTSLGHGNPLPASPIPANGLALPGHNLLTPTTPQPTMGPVINPFAVGRDQLNGMSAQERQLLNAKMHPVHPIQQQFEMSTHSPVNFTNMMPPPRPSTAQSMSALNALSYPTATMEPHPRSNLDGSTGLTQPQIHPTQRLSNQPEVSGILLNGSPSQSNAVHEQSVLSPPGSPSPFRGTRSISTGPNGTAHTLSSSGAPVHRGLVSSGGYTNLNISFGPHAQPSSIAETQSLSQNPMQSAPDDDFRDGPQSAGLTAGGPAGGTNSKPISMPNTDGRSTAPPQNNQLDTSATHISSAYSLPLLPANVNLNPTVTKVTPVPLIDSDKSIPSLGEDEIENIRKWMVLDREYDVLYRRMKEKMAEELRDDVFGPATIRWWEKGATSINPSLANGRRRQKDVFDVRYPSSRKDREPGRGKKGKREGLRLPQKLPAGLVNRPEQLVPIRLEFDYDHHKMRDTFVWNINDPIITPEHFAQTVVEDYALPSSYHSVIVRLIQEQLDDFKTHSAEYEGEGGDRSSGILKEDGFWWETWRAGLHRSGPAGTGRSHSRKRRKLIELPQSDSISHAPIHGMQGHDNDALEDMRILIKLDIIIGSMKLDDQFEWDLDNNLVTPEYFAEVYTKELGLGGEFRTAIAHSVREQVQAYQKTLFLVGRPSDDASVADEELKASFLPYLSSGARPIDQVQSYTPILSYLSDGEIERNEKERDKDMNRRKKRNTRGRRGIALPDREPVKTYRTPAIGFPELDAATLALQAAANAPVSRRAAAAAASVTIANMVASENGTPLLPQTLPTAPLPPPMAISKEKKPKGLFKPPTLPQIVLRPRAFISAPTLSTAADASLHATSLDTEQLAHVSSFDGRPGRGVTAKRAKELEREAKEKEYADGQHANFIDGIWHCSNCGCPESIAIGRRKGPLGDKSQCGTCGKFWHRHRRPRPVEYTTDLDYHMKLQREETVKSSGKKKVASSRAQASQGVPLTDSIAPEMTPLSRTKGEAATSSRSTPLPAILPEDDRPLSPVSTSSSGSESPLARKVKLNGTASSQAPAISALSPLPSPEPTTNQPAAGTDAPATPARSSPPPQWLTASMQATQTKYPHDRFEMALRRVNPASALEWRIKCVDCPGKLYKPGPGETLSNFEVHLKNRQHRQRVEERVKSGS